jgi:hypothetical protein
VGEKAFENCKRWKLNFEKAGGNLEFEINSSLVIGKLSSVKLPKMKLVTFQAN